MKIEEAPRTRQLGVYRALLHLFPRAFRTEYAEQVAQLFNDRLRDASRLGGRREIIGLWAAAVGDLVTNSTRMRFEQMSNILAMRSTLLVLAVVVYFGTVFGGGFLGLILLLLLVGLAMYQRKTLFTVPKSSLSPWIVVGAGLIIMAVAFGVTAIPGMAGDVRWGMAFSLGFGGLLTTGFGLGLAVWR